MRELHPGRDFPAPVDHGVPVFRIVRPNGDAIAVLFGYACHNTTLTGDFYEVTGDYAGYAQAELERSHKVGQAMFVELCGGDQNPSPRGKIHLPEQHGHELAEAVARVISKPMRRVSGPLRTAYVTVPLPFAPHTRAMFEEEASSTDVFKARRARFMLDAYSRGEPPPSVSYPVQALRFGSNSHS